jgi:DNA-binding beta-propeller fold protein YncE
MVVRSACHVAGRVALLGLVFSVCATSPAVGELSWRYQGCLVAADMNAPGCAPGGAIAGVTGLAFSPDGASLAVTGTRSSSVTLLSRDPATGALRALSCASDDATDGRDGTDGACTDADALVGPTAIVTDGARFYVAATRSGAVDVLGAGPGLPPQQCLKASWQDSHCGQEPALAGARALALAPGGGQLYVAAAGSSAVVTLQRDAATGMLAPRGCVSASGLDGHCQDGAALLAPTAIGAAPDGRAVYVVASGSQAVASFARDPSTGALRETGCIMARVLPGGTCRRAPSLAGAYAFAISPDGRDIYVAGRSADALTLLKADPTTATVRVAGCRGPPRPRGSCSPDGALQGVHSVAISSNGRAVVAATADGLELLARDPATGALQRAGCVRARPRQRTRCGVVAAVASARSVAVSPDSRDVYVGTETGLAVFRIEVT